MVFGAILAGGMGTRMGNLDKPKQFLYIGKKPIIIHTIEKFIINESFEKVIVLCPAEWLNYTKDLIRKFLPTSDVDVIEGGSTRNETIINAITHIEETYGLSDETVLVTHDAVRPFVTQRIIEENIEVASQGIPCDTMVPATDTIVESRDGKVIHNIPERSFFYQGQTPQSFKAKRFYELYKELTSAEKEVLTDAAKVFVMKGDEVAVVQGEVFNIKVTYPYDIQLAETLLGGDEKC